MNKTEKTGESRKQKIFGTARSLKKQATSLLNRALLLLKNSRFTKFLSQEETLKNAFIAAKCVGLAVAGFMFGRFPAEYMAYPLGIALLIASGKLSFFAYMGSALASLTYPSLGFAFFGVNTLIYIVRKLLLSDNFSESRRLRLITAFATSLFVTVSLVLAESADSAFTQENSSSLFCGAVYLITVPLAVALFYPAASSESCKASHVRASLLFFCFCIALSANYSLPFGERISYFFACVATLFFCVFFQGSFGALAGAFLGLATADFVFAAPLCISSFVFLKFAEKRKYSAYILFSVCLTLVSVFVGKPAAILPSLLGVLLFMPAGFRISAKNEAAKVQTALPKDAVEEAYTGRMARLSKAFGSVSKLCFGFSGRMKFPTEDEAAVIVSVCSAKSCAECSERAACRKKQRWCAPEISQNLSDGKLSCEKLPADLRERCLYAAKITQDINEEYRRLLSERFNNNKTEILAYEYSTLARILKYTSKVSSLDVYFDAKLTKSAVVAAKKLSLPNSNVTVYGTRKKVLEIGGVPISSVSAPSQQLASFFSAECGEVFDSPEFILNENGSFTLRFMSKEKITVEYVKASHTKNGETVSGDTVSFFRSDDSFFYALIADGMGSGREAAMTSRITSVFVEKLLSGGAGKGVTMELLNNLLMSKSRECFSGVDLLELDLIKKRASFVKAGAAPAYVLRRAKLFKVSSETPPCGIIEGFCAENTSFDVFSGDIIIMLSDGITSSIDCGTALCDIMNNAKGLSPQAVAGKILDSALTMTVHDDDMSCVLIKVK